MSAEENPIPKPIPQQPSACSPATEATLDPLLSLAGEIQQRIGQTLHDDICQELTGLILKADTLRLRLLEEENKEAWMAANILNSLEHTRDKVRSLSHGLIPLTVEAQALHEALAGLLASADEAYPIACRLDADVLDAGDSETATQLFHIAQEALRNALTYSQAGTITVTLRRQTEGLLLQIEDDGNGLDSRPRNNQGLGLHIMKLRAERIGATLEIGPGGQDGTRIRCSVPQRA